ncbi:hypothetical protein L0222_09060 [bacterium]|nr:hypothetical protein [bacterium]MCI0607343.1 hypothetical protein [bacterium]
MQLNGSADANQFQIASLEIGAGSKPAQWKKNVTVTAAVRENILGNIPVSELKGPPEWTIRLLVQHASGKSKEFWFNLKLQ